jgi:hypothetical protein
MITIAQPPFPTEENLQLRVSRFEKNVAMCLCVVPFIFSAQCLFSAMSAPVFIAVFADFGVTLPAPTRLVLSTWPFLALLALAAPISAVIVARRARAHFSVIFSTVVGLAMFLVAQSITLSLFLPVFQLEAVARGLK